MARSEAFELGPLTPADTAAGLALSAAAGWNQTADDWTLFIEQGHAIGVRGADGAVIATAAAIVHSGGLGWLAMVIVHPDWRHRGLASRLLRSSIERLRAERVTPMLDATPAGEPVYRQLGFRAGFAIDRWQGSAPPAVEVPSARVPAIRSGPADLEAIVALDATANGLDRRVLLTSFLSRPGTQAWMTAARDGFVLTRDGQRAIQLGPLVAVDEAGAIALLGTALRHVAGPVFLDVPRRWATLVASLQRAGFVHQRPFLRMSLGAAAPAACDERLFALAGPEFG